MIASNLVQGLGLQEQAITPRQAIAATVSIMCFHRMDILKKRSRKECCAKRALFQRALNDLASRVLGDSSAEITKTLLFHGMKSRKKIVYSKCGSEKRVPGCSSHALSRILLHEKPVKACWPLPS